VGFLRLHLQSSASTNSPPCHFVTSLLSSLSRGGTIHPIYTNFSYKTDPADVALVSPQTPLNPQVHPLLSGVCRRRHPWIPFCFRAFSGFFASSLAIIRLYKLSTLSLRDFPPLKPFERRDHLSDIYDDLGRTQGPTLQTFIRYTRNICLYCDISFDVHRSPCQRS